MVNHPDTFETYIKEVAIHDIESIPVPNMEDVWLDIEENLAKKQQKNNAMLYKRIATGVAAVLVLGLGIANTGEGYAYYERVIRYVTEVLENTVVIQIDHKNEANNINSNIKAIDNLEPIVYTLPLMDAIEKADFIVRLPNAIPKGFELKEVQLMEFNKKTISVELLYNNSQNKTMSIKQEPLRGEFSQVINVNPDHALVEEIIYNQRKYLVINFSNGLINVYWDMNEVRFFAEGNEKNQMMDMVLSIK